MDKRVVTQLQALLARWKDLGQTGLLYGSIYPYYDELVVVEQVATELGLSMPITAALRREIVGLYHGLTTAYNRLRYLPLLLAPPDHPDRDAFAARLTEPIQRFLIRFLAHQLACSPEDAGQRLEVLVHRGIYGVLEYTDPVTWPDAWLCVEQQRIRHALAAVCSGLPDVIIASITQFTDAIVSASAETHFIFPLATLITSPPNSPQRRKIGRRFAFGVPFIAHMRERQRRRRPNTPHGGADLFARTPYVAARERAFVTAIASRMQLLPKDVRSHLRDLCSSGVFGLLPTSMRHSLLAPELYAWLQLMRLGHIDKTIFWSALEATAREYACLIDQPVPSSALLKMLYARVPKPRFWHGGKGISVVRVHQRATRIRTQWPRLGAEWIVVAIRLPLGLAWHDTLYLYDQSTLILVLDGETELPVGGWLTGDTPGPQHVGLALYQAIWHVGSIDWPLRGIGRRICIPQTLLGHGSDNLYQAARFLHTTLAIETRSMLRGKQRAIALIHALKEDGLAEVRQTYGSQRPTVHQALQELLLWLQQRVFTGHRHGRVRPAIREHRVGMPGFTTQAAGWLLPRIGSGVTDNQGIWFQDRLYWSSQWQSITGKQLHCRGLPLDLPLEEATVSQPRRWLFIETEAHGMTRLVYLEEHQLG